MGRELNKGEASDQCSKFVPIIRIGVPLCGHPGYSSIHTEKCCGGTRKTPLTMSGLRTQIWMCVLRRKPKLA